MADAIWLLLKSWHRQFYRFGPLDLKVLASCIASHTPDLDRLRSRDILDFSSADELTVKASFRAFTVATRRVNKSGFQDSTVATAKTLHLFAPAFLPLWDNPIARRYGCLLMWSDDYVSFCWQMKEFAGAIKPLCEAVDDLSLLKRLDEFNYSAYTKSWVVIPYHAAATG